LEVKYQEETASIVTPDHAVKKGGHPFLKFTCPNQAENVKKLENYIAEWEESQKL